MPTYSKDKSYKPDAKSIKVIVKKFADEQSFQMENTSTVLELKQNILNSFPNLPDNTKTEDKLRLFFGGKELQNKEELWTYNIDDSSIVIMTIKMFVEESVKVSDS
jgi:hypothetical protein